MHSSQLCLTAILASAIATTSVSGETPIGEIRSKSSNMGPFYVYKKGDNVPKGYIKGASKVYKFDYYDRNRNDIALIYLDLSFVPGIASPSDSKCEKNRLLYKLEFKITVEDLGSKPVFLYSSPIYNGTNDYTIASTAGYNFASIH